MSSLEQVLSYVKSITETLNKWADSAKKVEELPVMATLDPEGLLIVSQMVNGVRTSKQLEIQKIIDGISLSGQNNKVREVLLGTITSDQNLDYLLDNFGMTVVENEVIVLTALTTINSTLVQKQYLWKLGKGEFNPIGSANISTKMLELQPRLLNEIISDELTSSPSAVVYEFGVINSPILDIINSSNPAYDFTDEEKIYYIRFVQNDVKILYNFIGINNTYGVGQNQMTQLDLVLVYSSANSDPTALLNSKVDRGGYNGTALDLYYQITSLDEDLSTRVDDFEYEMEEIKLPLKADKLTTYTKTEVDAKINNYFKGVYLTEATLIAAHPTANIGDYAQVNEVGATDVVNYNWDAEENIWVKNAVAGSGATNTDALPEGTNNLYFTVTRFLANLTYANIIAALGFTPSQAPNNAQKNSDITKAEIEAKYTGVITTHTHEVRDVISYALSSLTSDLVVGDTDTFHAPYNFTITNFWIGVKVAPTVSSVLVDIKKNGTSITTTKAGINAGSFTSLTGTSPVITNSSFTKGDSIIPVISQIGSGETGKSLKIYLEVIKS